MRIWGDEIRYLAKEGERREKGAQGTGDGKTERVVWHTSETSKVPVNDGHEKDASGVQVKSRRGVTAMKCLLYAWMMYSFYLMVF